MALTNPFRDTIETPQFRTENPGKFWANVVVAIFLLPIAAGGLAIGASELLTALQQQGF
ncbi:hypothetical protein [Tsuneonella mangrovi]|uniref:hypothetical protein n=1 Tax=Tsuneonella mangrovi TaxID=1982042 RepID=UPI001470C4D5|nr:hypothetical protein [Tsuneonella mangrovi]